MIRSPSKRSHEIDALDSDSAGRYITKRYHRSPFKCLSKSSLELPPLVAVEDENPEEIHSSESQDNMGGRAL